MSPGRRAPIRRLLTPLALALLSVLLSVVVLAGGYLVGVSESTPSDAQTATRGEESTMCPAMTDSIRRLYLALLDREPDDAEFLGGVSRYRSGQADLETIATELARSNEFRAANGELSDEQYVELVYRNVLQREPTEGDRDFWVTNLGIGYERGSTVVAFSESEEFVRRTGTVTPLAGYLRWYPEGAHWYCGVGPRDALTIKPLLEPGLYADYVFRNGGDTMSPIGLQTVLNNASYVSIAQGTLPARFTGYWWSGMFSGDGNYGSALDVLASDDTSWIVVFYGSSIGDQRAGWQIER